MHDIRHILNNFLKETPYKKRYEATRVLAAWDEIVGQVIAQETIPQKVEHGKLFVKVSHPTWRQELIMQKFQLIKKINRFIGSDVIKDIFFN